MLGCCRSLERLKGCKEDNPPVSAHAETSPFTQGGLFSFWSPQKRAFFILGSPVWGLRSRPGGDGFCEAKLGRVVKKTIPQSSHTRRQLPLHKGADLAFLPPVRELRSRPGGVGKVLYLSLPCVQLRRRCWGGGGYAAGGIVSPDFPKEGIPILGNVLFPHSFSGRAAQGAVTLPIVEDRRDRGCFSIKGHAVAGRFFLRNVQI